MLCAAALSACASASSLAGDQSAAKPDAQDNAANNSMADNLDDEIRQAQILRVKGDYAGALRVLGQLMLVAADDPRVVGEYGKVLVQQGQPAEGVEFLKRAVELQPADWTLYSALGVACDQSGDLANAQLAYERALALKPGEPVVLNNYAMSRLQAGDTVGAKKLIDQAAATGSADPKIAHNVALIDGLVPPVQSANIEPVASAQPAQAKSVAAVLSTTPQSSVAQHAPRTLIAGASPGVVMQRVPVDPKAGPVSPKRIAKAVKAAAHHPRGTASLPALRTADHLAKSEPSKHKPADKIPSLRLADGQ
jgi:Flp pilus assembly protein TadD